MRVEIPDALVDEIVAIITQRITLPAAKPSGWLTNAQAAEQLGIKPNTLEIQRTKGLGPKYYRVGRNTIRYKQEDIDAYISTKKRAGTSAPVRGKRDA